VPHANGTQAATTTAFFVRERTRGCHLWSTFLKDLILRHPDVVSASSLDRKTGVYALYEKSALLRGACKGLLEIG